jgi:beta-phosphoglucomutase
VPYSPDKDFPGIFGRHNTDIMTSQWGITDSDEIERMAETKERYFRKEAALLKPLPGVIALISALHEAGWKQAIGSSAPLENLGILIKASGVGKFMDAIVSGDDVSKGKPDPQVFLLAFERLEVEPRNGVVVEDAPSGVQAARRAGAACLAITTSQTEETLTEAGAHLVVPTFKGFRVEYMEMLVTQVQKAASK